MEKILKVKSFLCDGKRVNLREPIHILVKNNIVNFVTAENSEYGVYVSDATEEGIKKKIIARLCYLYKGFAEVTDISLLMFLDSYTDPVLLTGMLRNAWLSNIESVVPENEKS